MTRRFFVSLAASVAFCLTSAGFSQAPQSAGDNADMMAGLQLYRSGRFAEAADKFQSILRSQPNLVPAQEGLIHSLLHAQKIDEAFALANSAVKAQPNSAPLITALGDVQFRFADIPAAERSYLKALGIDSRQIGAYIGLSRVYYSYSLYRRAYDQLAKAHEIAPNDPNVQIMWFNMLPRGDRMAAIEAYLAEPRPTEETSVLRRYLAILKATADQPVHACKLVSQVAETNTKLEAVAKGGQRLGASGIEVKINGQKNRLMLDTGASGLVLSRQAAEKAGLKNIGPDAVGGMGDTGQQSGYLGLAGRIAIGQLEFQDCLVHVTDNPAGPQGDGLIGTDVFSSYLIDIDIPSEKLRLSPLPKRPDEAAASTALNSEGEAIANPSGQVPSPAEPSNGTKLQLTLQLPKDAYVAPEMANWTKVYRFGHLLLVTTLVDQSKSMLFMVDTGAFTNILSTRAARQVAVVRADPNLQVKGLSGTVTNVYRADQATLQFGHYYQQNQHIVTLDLSSPSNRIGTEVSGILGFELLRLLQVKIDYRDGLVDFIYDPNHLPKQVKFH